MATGRLHVCCGPMFAGKTTTLLHLFFKLRSGGRRPLIVKPSFDARYGVEIVASHDGLKAPAYPVSRLEDIDEAIVKHDAGHLLVDEVQFFSEDRYTSRAGFVRDVNAIRARGIDITCVGLDCDWRGHPFEVTASLLAMADDVTKLTAFCAVCGQAASKTGKIAGAREASVEIGGSESYEARCVTHWSPEILEASCRNTRLPQAS